MTATLDLLLQYATEFTLPDGSTIMQSVTVQEEGVWYVRRFKLDNELLTRSGWRGYYDVQDGSFLCKTPEEAFELWERVGKDA